MLINCPECGHRVSDQAATCPSCGIKIAGNVIPQRPAQTIVQPASAPVGGNPEPQQKPKKKGSHTLLIVSFIIAVAICGVGYYYYNDMLQQKERIAYENVLQSGNEEDMQRYLAEFRDAPQEHRDSITSLLQSLRENDRDWTNAVVSGSKGALEEYVRNNPNSPHKGEVLNKIDSIDYSIADRARTIESYTMYLHQHPDGKYADQAQEFIDKKKETEVTSADIQLARSTCRQFFQAINSKNESKLIDTVTEYLTSFLNRTGASSDDVITFMKSLYKDADIQNLNWHILDDFKVEKKKDEVNDSYILVVKFGAEKHVDRTDHNKETLGKYVISAEITPDGKISKLNMKKQTPTL